MYCDEDLDSSYFFFSLSGTLTDMDYTLISREVVFPFNGLTIQCLTIITIDDQALESPEEFVVQFSSSDAAVVIVGGQVNVTILDNDGEDEIECC